MLSNIPDEMRVYKQWIVWRYEDRDSTKPVKVPYCARTHNLADVTDPSTWVSFDEAVHALRSSNWYAGIGFVLTDNDPYLFIDLDDPYELKPNGQYKHANPQKVRETQLKIYEEFNSYAERSPSGKGLHIIAKASLPSGRRRSSIEVYSSVRYMTMTGDVFRNTPIVDYNDLANVLWAQMGRGTLAAAMYAGTLEVKDTDEEVIRIACDAANGQKFKDLLYGRWTDYYDSQSEADFALVDIVAFYTQNRQQITRIFRASGLGQRDKAKRADYVKYMLNKCFDRMLPPVDIEGIQNQLRAALEAKAKASGPPASLSNESQLSSVTTVPTLPQQPASVYSVPPGLTGEIAQYIYSQAPLPVGEIALAGGIGLMAGIVGRAYNISGTGLNHYVLLLAGTGKGKEAMQSGISKLMSFIAKTVPASAEFIGPGEIASPQALLKYMASGPKSFLSMVGEFGIKLNEMSGPFASVQQVGLRRMYLDLYNKSGSGNSLKPSIYSDKANNTAEVNSPAFSLLGESSPEKYYEIINESMISEGFLPRFDVIEYHGPRVPFNYNHMHAQPSFDLINKLGELCAYCLMLNSQDKHIQVQIVPEADKMLKQFNIDCTARINEDPAEVKVQLWNRAHVKALKMAGLIAVGQNHYDPCVSIDNAQWAITLVMADIHNMLRRFEAGEIGVDNEETKQLSKAMSVIKDFITLPWDQVRKYTADTMGHLHTAKIIPFSYLQRRLAAVAVFRKDRQGASGSLKRTLQTLCDRGDISLVSRATMGKDYETAAQCYMIANLKAFGLI